MSGADHDQARGQARLKEFKNVNKGKNEWRQRRNNSSSELRQNRRDNQIAKRRIPILEQDGPEYVSDVKLEQLQDYVQQTVSNDALIMLQGVSGIRKLMCVKQDPPIKRVVSTGVHMRLVQLLAHENLDLQFEAAWALTNIVSGDKEDTQSVADAGAIPSLVQLLGSDSDKVRAQAAWALGNIAGDCVSYRDSVLREGAMEYLLKLLWAAINGLDSNRARPVPEKHDPDHEILQTGTWAISNFVRGTKTDPNYYAMIEGAVEFLAMILNFSDDHPTLADACWALSYLTDADAKRIQKVVEAGVVGRLVKLMDYSNSTVVLPAQRTIGNILAGSDVQTTVVLNHAPLKILDKLLTDENELIRKESAWAISNIFAGTDAQIAQPLEEENGVPRYRIVDNLLRMMIHDANNKARKEAAWAIANLMSLGNMTVMNTLIYGHDGLNAIMRFLKSDAGEIHLLRSKGSSKSADSMEKLAMNILNTLLNKVLPAGDTLTDSTGNPYGFNIYVQRIKELGLADIFEDFAATREVGLAKVSTEIVAKFFSTEAEGAEYFVDANEGVNCDGQMEFNPNLQGGGIQL